MGKADDDERPRYDREGISGLDYAMARHYASGRGTFLSPDPGHVGAFLEDPQSWNAYTYGPNDPINYADPSGAYRVRIQNPGECWASLGGSVEEVSLGLERYTEADSRQEGGRITVNVVEGWREVFEHYCNYSVGDIAHTALDFAGFVPVIGEIADLANAGIYAAQGDAFNAGISMAAMVPGIGSIGTGGRVVGRGIKGFTKHGVDQALTRGFRTPDILRIVREGNAVQKIGRYGPNVQHSLGPNTVVISQSGRNAGKVISVFSDAPGTRRGIGRGSFMGF